MFYSLPSAVSSLPTATTNAPPTTGLGAFFNDTLALGGRVLEGLGEFELAKYQIKTQAQMEALQRQQEASATTNRSEATAEVSAMKWVKPVVVGGGLLLGSVVLLKAFKVL